MAGMVGVISHRRTVAVPEAELDALVDAFGHVRGMGTQRRQRVADWAHLATFDVGPPATVAVAGDSWFAAVGAIHADGPLAQARVEDLDGQFAAVRHDADAGSVEVFSDPFGMQALYVAVRGERTYISTSAGVLARHLAAAPDELGIRVFLRSGYQIGPATHWMGVERVEPGTCLTFTDGHPRPRVYWLPQVDERVRGMALEQAADHCTEVALDVFRRRLGGGPRSWLDLTGGFDSRMVAAAAARAQVPFIANTSGEPGDVDVELARRVAEAAGFQWQRIGVGQGWGADAQALGRAAAWADGTLDAFTLARVLRRHELKTDLSSHVITGGGGEHFNSFPWQQEFLRAGRRRAVNYDALLSMRYLKQVDTGMLVQDPHAEVREYFREHLSARAGPYRATPNTTQLDVIYAYKSVGHFGAYRSAGEGVVRTDIPCYYRELFVSAFSADHRWRNNHRLQRRVIARLSPDLAALPTTRGGSAQPISVRTAHQLLPYYSSVAQRAARKLSRLGKPALPAAMGAELVDYYRRGAAALRAENVLEARNMISAGLYDSAKLEAFIARSAAADFDEWSMLGRIATVELTLRAAARAP
jgi:asparagine synthase (glutamine-hydrolysing)